MSEGTKSDPDGPADHGPADQQVSPVRESASPGAVSAPPGDRMRASDTDRERVASVLREALVEGRLTMAELDERLTRTFAAATIGDLRPVIADIPGHEIVLASSLAPHTASSVVSAPPTSVTSRSAAAAPTGAETVDGPPSGSLAAVFGGVQRKGRWIVPRSLRLTTVFGGADLDMTRAAFGSSHMTIKANIVFGGAQLIVPDGVVVHSHVTAIFGGADNSATEPGGPGAPVIEVTGFAIFGGLSIRRPKPKELQATD